MNLLFDIRILEYNVQDHDPNAQAMILTLELQSQRSSQCISYEYFWFINFIVQDQWLGP